VRAFPPPREFQQRAHEALRQGFTEGHRAQVLMAATGAGKTYLGLRLANEAVQRGRRAVFVCDRKTLVDQTSRTADAYGMTDHGIIQASHWRHRPSAPFQIVTSQTMGRRGQWPQADVYVIDECHTQHSSWVDLVQGTKAAVIGLSATPFSDGLGRIFSRVVNAATMDELTRAGVLVPMRVLSCKRPDMTGAKLKKGGEWDEKDIEARGMGLIGDVVSEWLKHGEGRKTICFGATIAHCEELCRQFNSAGVMAAVFTARTPEKERESLLDEYRKHDSALRVLVSVEALAKGFDVPDVSCVIDCRPLRKSLSTAIQMWGRGLRSSKETGKRDCILLDHSGNILRFRADFEDIYFNGLNDLDSGEKLDKEARKEPKEKEAKRCPVCGYAPFARRCMSCGHEVQSRADIEHEAGTMTEVVLLNGKRMGESPAHVWAQCATYAKLHSAPEKQHWRAAYIFKDITGQMPPKGWTVDVPFTEVTRPVMNKIKSKNLAYAARARATA
jgi:DNA repair protein RadD